MYSLQRCRDIVLVQLVLLFVFTGSLSLDKVFEPSGPAKVHVWSRTDKPDFVYPEQSESGPWGIPSLLKKPNFGVAISGGGFRATTLGYGWVRALHEVRGSQYLNDEPGHHIMQVKVASRLSPHVKTGSNCSWKS
jgi:hypothetical protein